LHSAEPDYVATAVESEYFVEELVQIVRYGMSLGHTESGKFVDEVLKVSNLLNNGCGVFLHKHLLSYPGEGLQLKTVICIVRINSRNGRKHKTPRIRGAKTVLDSR
jgi:hypothetical protein